MLSGSRLAVLSFGVIMAESVSRRRPVKFAVAFSTAVGRWDALEATPLNKLKLRVSVLNPIACSAIVEFLVAMDSIEGAGAFAGGFDDAGIDPENLAKFIELVIKYLPQILAILALFI